MSSDLERRIRQRAYELWEAEGQPEGRDSHHWTQAEVEFAEARAVENVASAASAPTRAKPIRRSKSPESGASAPSAEKPKRPRKQSAQSEGDPPPATKLAKSGGRKTGKA